MKKIIQIIMLLSLFGIIGYLVFTYNSGTNAISLYKVYLNGEVIGIIDSKVELEDYIDNKGKAYKKEYGVDTIYAPEGIEIKKESTYSTDVDSIETIYKKIVKIEPFTIKGYEFTIKSEDDSVIVYTLEKNTFDEAVEKNYITYVGQEDYDNYIDNNQDEINTTGLIIESIYVEEDITIKESYVPLDKTIYTSSDALAQYLLFGENKETSEYLVKIGDTIESISFDNEISAGDFLILNPSFASEKDLLFPGQEVKIGITNPQLSVVIVEYVVEDKVDKYKVEYQYEPEEPTSYEEVLQDGIDGMKRVTQRNKIVNGAITYVSNISNESIKATVNQLTKKGQKVLSGIGSAKNWLWPTESGYTITSTFGYRKDPFGSDAAPTLHAALDIAGLGYGSNIYSTTDGVVIISKLKPAYGNYICINHNVSNLYTCYAHLIKRYVQVGDIVERGEVIGTMGSTGLSTGPHLHFEVWIGYPFRGGYRINPWKMY